MKEFLKIVFGTIFGLILFGILTLLFFVVVGAASSSSDTPTLADKSVLHLKLENELVERRKPDNPFSKLTNQSEPDGLYELLSAIKEAKNNPDIKGIFIETRYVVMGSASAEEIREALIDFKQSKKFIIAYAEFFSEKAYYIASVADKVYLNPGGELEFNGMASTVPFIKGFLAKLEIQPEVFKAGDFKSAVEPLILDKMSDSSRLAAKVYLNSLNDFMVGKIAESRKMSFEEAKKIQDSMLVTSAAEAVQYKLADALGYRDQAISDIKARLELKDKDKVKLVTYNKVYKVAKAADDNESDNRIAVIYGEGEIEGAESDNGIGSDEICEALKKARDDDKIKAVVLRVNSPGGSALASDIMWREIQLTRAKKPVIASMGDVAASGGYYMCMGADTIVAMPNTVTGSIGVFGVLFNVQGLMNNKLGVTADVVKTGLYSDFADPSRRMTDGERKIIQRSVVQIYDTFTTKAALGRKMPVETLKRYASGRVWAGQDAKQRGLVDVLGGFNTAVEIAAKRAGLKAGDYSLKFLPAQKDFVTELLETIGKDTENAMMKARLGMMYPIWKEVERLKHYNGVVQARLPFDLNPE